MTRNYRKNFHYFDKIIDCQDNTFNTKVSTEISPIRNCTRNARVKSYIIVLRLPRTFGQIRKALGYEDASQTTWEAFMTMNQRNIYTQISHSKFFRCIVYPTSLKPCISPVTRPELSHVAIQQKHDRSKTTNKSSSKKRTMIRDDKAVARIIGI